MPDLPHKKIIISIRGTHGSGKSTIVKDLLSRMILTKELMGTKKIDGYVGFLPDQPPKKVSIIGSYANACGGCDGIQPYSLIWPRVEEYYKVGSVVFEGALVSSSYGNIGRDSEKYGTHFIFAFLDTPMEVCLDRIRKRREAKGNPKPVDPRNTQNKYDSIIRSIPKIRDEFKRRVTMLNYLDPIPQIMELLRRG